MTVAAMLSREGRRRGVHDNDDGEEEVVEVEDSDETVAALGGSGRRKGGFEESLRRTARPTAPTGRMGAVTTKLMKTCRPSPHHRIVGDSGVDCRDDNGGRGGGGDGGSENDDCGQDGDHDDVRPSSSSSSYSYHPSFSSADPPAPSLLNVAGGGGTRGAWRRWRRPGQRGGAAQVEAGRRQPQRPRNRHGGGGFGNRYIKSILNLLLTL